MLDLHEGILEEFVCASTLGTDHFYGLRLIDPEKERVARRVLVDRRTREARKTLGLPVATPIARKPGGMAWRARPVIDQNGNQYQTLREAAAKTRVSHVTIMKILRGKLDKSRSGFIFRYV